MDQSFKQSCIKYIEMNPERISKCLSKLTEDQVWAKPNESVNSIGNLILHVQGNMTQYILSGLGGLPDIRIRDEEFTSYKTHSKEELINSFNETIKKVVNTILNLQPTSLLEEYQIQGFTLIGMEVIIHVTEHLSYHVGQIALMTKLTTNSQVGFYENLDLNKLNN